MATKDLESLRLNGGATVIGESILINGKLSGDEDLTVRGRCEGELTLTKTLIVETTGIIKANVAVKNAIVSGVVVGNINATESVELTKEGRMVGDIHAPRVIIVDGASFRGRVDMGEVEPGRINTARPTIRPTTRSSPARPPSPPPRPELKAREGSKAPPPPPPPSNRGAPASSAKAPSKVPPPPLPPVVGSGAKKKVLIKRKGK
jgi:cytoskeletal protein CcmA (bactofilin family)